MNIHRPENFDEVIGHSDIIRLLTSRIEKGNLPQFIILHGEEGLGKTTLLDLVADALDSDSEEAHKEIIENLIRGNRSTSDIKKYNMASEDKGITEAKSILGDLTNSFIIHKARVILMEDIHAMCNTAQEMLLSAFEYIPKDVYVLASANSLNTLLKKFLSRAVILALRRLSDKEMHTLLRIEAKRRNMKLECPAILDIITKWAENKPRKALKALEAMGDNCSVSLDDVKTFTSYLDINKFIPILDSFTGSPLVGMTACMNMPTDDMTQRYMIDFLIDAIRLKKHQPVIDIALEDRDILKRAVSETDVNVLESFLLEIARMPTLDNTRLLVAYMMCHPSRERITKNDDSVLTKELQDKFDSAPMEDTEPVKLPNIDNLIRDSTVIEGVDIIE